MSKDIGQKIAIRFTEKLTNVNENPLSAIDDSSVITKVYLTHSGNVELLKDNNINTYWESRSSGNYVQLESIKLPFIGFKVYKGSSYKPLTYAVSGSLNGSAYNNLISGSFTAEVGWETINFPEPIEYTFIRINFGYSSRLYLYELVPIFLGYDEFSISWREYKYVDGPFIEKNKRILSLERHPLDSNNILLLTMHPQERFNNAEGDVTISYDMSKGVLTGRGGAVESFVKSFTPTDLGPKPNPHGAENITISLATNSAFVKVFYTNAYAEHTINISAVASHEFLYVGTINP